jgi:SAM-dependent methyltransferase
MPQYSETGYPLLGAGGAGADQVDGYDPAMFEQLVRLEAGNFWFENRNRVLVDALNRFFPHARSFLEIGCGTGFVLSGFSRARPQLELSGSDIYVEGLHVAHRQAGAATLFQMDARRIPFEAEFDVIGAFDVIEHIPEDEQVLSQMRNAVRPGGGLMITVPQHRFLWSAFDEAARHQRRYSRTELLAKVRAAGLRVLHVTSFTSLLLPLMLMSRVRARRVGDSYDPLDEIRIARWLNALLGGVLSVERAMLGRGVTLPAGGSLLLVAERPE